MAPQIKFEDFYVGAGLGEQDVAVYLLPNSFIVICSYSASGFQKLALKTKVDSH